MFCVGVPVSCLQGVKISKRVKDIDSQGMIAKDGLN